MNKISKIAAVALVALGTAFSGSAQNMTVTTRDGQKHKFKTTDVEHVTFDGTTLEQGPFEVTVSEITSASAKLEVIPENKSLTYYFDVCMKSDYERTTVKRIVENYFVQMQESYPQLDLETILEATLSRGDDSDVVKGLPSDCEMVCYAIGVDANGLCVGEPTVVPFRTLPPGKPEDCTFEISYSDLDAESLTVIVKPSDPAISYWMGVAGVFDYPGDAEMTNLVKRTLEQYCEAYGRDMNEIVQGVTFKGDLSIIESGLEANRPYYIYVYAMDENGDAAGLVHKLQFVTADNVWSEADVEATWRWYDGNALAEAYPNGEYDKAKGGVLLQPVFTPNEKAAVYYWALGVGDMTDKSTYPDETTKYSAQVYGYTNVPTKNMLVHYGDCTLIYYASDEYGLDGELHRSLIHVTPEGCSPVESFSEIDIENPQPVAPRQMKVKKTKPADLNTNIRKRMNKLNGVPAPMREHELF